MNAPPARPRRTDTTTLLQTVSQWMIGAILVVVLTLFFLALNAAQLSAEETGHRLLRRGVAVTTNIDVILPDLQEALREQAQTGSEDSVRVPDFPIPVDIPRDDALTLEGAELRERILDQSAARLYDDGMSAWADTDPDGQQDIELVSSAGLYQRGLGLISDANHDRIVIATVVLGVLSLLFTVVLLATARSWGRLVALSAVTMAAALPSLAGAVAVRFGFRAAQEEADPFVFGLLDLGVEAMWVPIRNYFALTILGLTAMVLTLIFIWLSARLEAGSGDAPPA